MSGNQTRPGNVAALENASGISWQAWLDHFESKGARELGHAEIARIARAFMPETMKSPDWWAQGATIAYEQAVGIRVPGQSSAGSFRVSASKTLAGDRDDLLERWITHVDGREHLNEATVSQVRRSRTEKRSFWRATLDGVGKVEVAVSAKPGDGGKSLVAISHTDLPDEASIEPWRAFWRVSLDELAELD